MIKKPVYCSNCAYLGHERHLGIYDVVKFYGTKEVEISDTTDICLFTVEKIISYQPNYRDKNIHIKYIVGDPALLNFKNDCMFHTSSLLKYCFRKFKYK